MFRPLNRHRARALLICINGPAARLAPRAHPGAARRSTRAGVDRCQIAHFVLRDASGGARSVAASACGQCGRRAPRTGGHWIMSELATATAADSVRAITRVTMAVDASPASQRLAAYVRDLVRPGMHVSVVGIAENPRVLTPQLAFDDAMLATARQGMRRAVRDALGRASGIVSASGADVDARLIDQSHKDGAVADALVADARMFHADLLAVGARQHRGMLRWTDASVSRPVTRDAHCSLLIVPERFERKHTGPLERIVFAIDGSAASLHAMRYALQLAPAQSRLLAVYVVDRALRFQSMPALLLEDAYIAEGERALGHAATIFARCPNPSKTALLSTRTVGDDIAHALVREAIHLQADLLVVGTHGRRGLSGWLLGSVARRVARLSDVPVLLVRPIA
jgi:nucleotide-binding universal stress UspA family protein